MWMWKNQPVWSLISMVISGLVILLVIWVMFKVCSSTPASRLLNPMAGAIPMMNFPRAESNSTTDTLIVNNVIEHFNTNWLIWTAMALHIIGVYTRVDEIYPWLPKKRVICNGTIPKKWCSDPSCGLVVTF